MITNITERMYTPTKRYIEAVGLSKDEKPVDGVANGSSFIEMDTGKLFFFDEESAYWYEFTGGGGE